MRRTITPASGQAVERAAQALRDAELVLVGASNGLDIAEGFDIFKPDAHFAAAYGDFARAYGIGSVLHGLAGTWQDQSARWAFLARFAKVEWLDYQPSKAMHLLRQVVGDRPSFVVTSNIDGHFASAGFAEDHVLELEGTVRELVCTAHADHPRVPAAEAMRRAANGIVDLRVPEGLIPRCATCGAPMEPAFDEARALHPDAAYARRLDLLAQAERKAHGGRIAVLELGVGPRNQGVRGPLLDLALREEGATYIALNYAQVSVPAAIAGRSVTLQGDLTGSLERIASIN